MQCLWGGGLQGKFPVGGRSLRSIHTLSKQETDSNAGKVESIEPSLYFVIYPSSVMRSLPLEDALCNGGDRGVVPPLDVL